MNKASFLQNDLSFYATIRHKIGTGDIFECCGNYPVSRMIRFVTGYSTNHTGILIRFSEYDADRVYTTEALDGGFMPWPFSKRIAEYDGQIYWHRLKPEYDRFRAGAARWTIRNWGKPYDHRAMLSNWRKIFRKLPEEIDDTMLYCSEAVFMAFKIGAEVPWLQHLMHAPVPGQIVSDLGLHFPKVPLLPAACNPQ
jgi:uncharacterized protein YycO